MPQFPVDRKTAPFHSVEEATAHLVHSAPVENVRHLSYWYLQYVDGAPDQVIWVATYDPTYMSLYMSNFTPMDDPVINRVMDNKFVDWAEWIDVDQVAQTVDPVMSRYGITKYGISLPLPAPGEDKIIFSACIDSNDVDWPYQRASLARRMVVFANEFDNRMRHLVRAGQQGDSVFKLSA